MQECIQYLNVNTNINVYVSICIYVSVYVHKNVPSNQPTFGFRKVDRVSSLYYILTVI